MSGPAEPTPTSPVRLTLVGADYDHMRAGGTDTAQDLSQRMLASSRLPRTGWRGHLYRVSRGRVNLRGSAGDRELDDRLTRIVTQLGGWHSVTVVASKGGVGRTTLTAGLGLALARSRGDRVIAVDAHPEVGTLAGRLLGEAPVRGTDDLLAHLAWNPAPTDVAAFTGRVGNLDVLASRAQSRATGGLSGLDYGRLLTSLRRCYNVILTDTSPLLGHPTTLAAMAQADTVVVVATASIDGAEGADRTLNWLRHYRRAAADEAIVVLSGHQSHPRVDHQALRSYFAARCRAVVEVPDDPHLAGGGPLDPTELRPDTHAAFLSLAAHVGDQFARASQVPRTGAST